MGSLAISLAVLTGALLSPELLASSPGHASDCYDRSSNDPSHAAYYGSLNRTTLGTPCQRWGNIRDSNFLAHFHHYFPPPLSPDSLENFCRDPAGKGMIWCYTETRLLHWEACNVPDCNDPASAFSGKVLRGQDTSYTDFPVLEGGEEGYVSDPLLVYPAEEERRSVSRAARNELQMGWWSWVLSCALAMAVLAET